jgi:hypothetical protein
MQDFHRERRERSNFEGLCKCWPLLFKWIFKMYNGYMDSTDVALDRHKWQSLMKMVIKHQVLFNTGNFLAGWGTVSFSGRTLLQGIIKLFS